MISVATNTFYKMGVAFLLLDALENKWMMNVEFVSKLGKIMNLPRFIKTSY